MKPILRFIFFVISVFILVNCARTGRPEGGPKDENPPLFVTANPPYKTINFDDKEIKLSSEVDKKSCSDFLLKYILPVIPHISHKNYL